MVFSRNSKATSQSVSQQELNESIDGMSVVLERGGRFPPGEESVMSRSSSFLLPHRIPQVPTIAQLPAQKQSSPSTSHTDGPGKTFSIDYEGATQYFRMGADEAAGNIKESIRCVFSLPPTSPINLVDYQSRNVIVSYSALVHTAHYSLFLPEKPPVSYIEVPCTPLPQLDAPPPPLPPKSVNITAPLPPREPNHLTTLRTIIFLSLLVALLLFAASAFFDPGVDIYPGPPPHDASYPAVWRNEAGSILVRYVTQQGSMRDHALSEGLNTVGEGGHIVFRYEGGVVARVGVEL